MVMIGVLICCIGLVFMGILGRIMSKRNKRFLYVKTFRDIFTRTNTVMIGVLICCIGLVFMGILGLIMAKRNKRREWPRDTVILHQLGRGPWAPSLSPFPLKLETYLRMADIPYMNNHQGGMSYKGKTPWMTYNGDDVADSQLCIDYLNKRLGVDLNANLDVNQRAIAKAFQRLTEENLYWTMCAQTFSADLSGLERLMPYKGLKNYIICRLFRYRVKTELWGHGIGRHSPTDILQIGHTDLQALSQFIGDKPFLMGEEPCEQDCAVFGMLSQIIWHQPDSPHNTLIQEEFTNLRSYCERMKARYWPDWDNCITHGHTRAATL